MSTSEYTTGTTDKNISPYNTKTKNFGLLKKMSNYSGTRASDFKGFIINFDITDKLLQSNNVLTVYMYTASDGASTQIHSCVIPAAPAVNNSCEFWESYTQAETGAVFTDKGFDKNTIQFRKNSVDPAKFDIKINAGSWVFFDLKLILFNFNLNKFLIFLKLNYIFFKIKLHFFKNFFKGTI